MKKIIMINALMLFNFCSAQSRTDLSALKTGSANDLIVKNTTKQTDLEQTTGYPYYSTFKVDQYQYGGINFLVDYPKEKNTLKVRSDFWSIIRMITYFRDIISLQRTFRRVMIL